MNKIITLLLCLLQLNVVAQFSDCGTIDAPDSLLNHQAFEKYKSEFIKNSHHKMLRLDTITIAAHIIRSDEGLHGISLQEIINEVNLVNKQWEGTGIYFQVCDDVNFIDNSDFVYFNVSRMYDLSLPHNFSDVVNIYFAKSLYSERDDVRQEYGGVAVFPADRYTYRHCIFMQNESTSNGSTLSHELGHFFGLIHTHEPGELVNGSNCAYAGDKICDTPAEPRLNIFNVDLDCAYIGNETDSNGEKYKPNTRNIMSYSRIKCKNFLTPEQKIRIAYYKNGYRSYLKAQECYLADLTFQLGNTFNTFMGGEKKRVDIEILNLTNRKSVECKLLTNIFDDNNEMIVENLEYDVSTIEGNDSLRIRIPIDLPISIKSGEYYVKHTIDHNNDVAEENEDNNEFIQSFRIDNSKLNNFSLYPNNTNSSIRLFLNDDTRGTTYFRVFNMSGQLIMKNMFVKDHDEFHIEFDLPAGLASGIYHAALWTPLGVKSQNIFLP